MVGIFDTAKALFFRKKPEKPPSDDEPEPEPEQEPDEVVLQITRQKFNALIESIDTRLDAMSDRISGVEGSFGRNYRAVKEKLEAEEKAHAETRAALDEAISDREEAKANVDKFTAFKEAIPGVLEQLGFAPEAKAKLFDALARQDVHEFLMEELEQHFPGEMGITPEGLLALAPTIIGFMQKLGFKPAEKEQAAPAQPGLPQGGATF